MILDCHTHLPAPKLQGIVSCESSLLPAPGAFAGQLYSCGYHPWRYAEGRETTPQERMALREAMSRSDVVALGECGIDLLKGGPLFRQLLEFQWQAELAEESGKPLVIHSVRAHDSVIGLHRQMKPSIPWVIHGFAGKPTVAEMYLKEGLLLSFGPCFNPSSLMATPAGSLLAETDASGRPIAAVIELLATARGIAADELREAVARNTARVFRLEEQ